MGMTLLDYANFTEPFRRPTDYQATQCNPAVLHYILLFQYEKQPGDTYLYHINWGVVLQTQWRHFAVKPPLRMIPDRQFLIVSHKEFNFLEHHDALIPFHQKKHYFIKESPLLDYRIGGIFHWEKNLQILHFRKKFTQKTKNYMVHTLFLTDWWKFNPKKYTTYTVYSKHLDDLPLKSLYGCNFHTLTTSRFEEVASWIKKFS